MTTYLVGEHGVDVRAGVGDVVLQEGVVHLLLCALVEWVVEWLVKSVFLFCMVVCFREHRV